MSPLFARTFESLKLVDFWLTPFLRISTAVPRTARLRERFARFADGGLPVIQQLMGRNPELLARAAAQFASLGTIGININFACPSQTVVRNGSGGTLLKSPSLMEKILAAVRKETAPLPLSVKLRAGFKSPTEMPDTIAASINGGADFIILHFRTVMDNYDRIPDGPERIAKAVELAGPIPLIASGDLFSVADAKHLYSVSRCAGITPARGLAQDPMLIRRMQAAAAGQKTPQEDIRGNFLNTMRELASKNSALHTNRAVFLEIARHLWGADSAEFKMISKDFALKTNSK